MSAKDDDRTIRSLGGNLFRRYILTPFANFRAREATFHELTLLDDRMLKDIGVARCRIPGLVAFRVVQQEAVNEDRPPQSRIANENTAPPGMDGRKLGAGCE
jgi:uncharacterized protein YjiS (DUF1127 family)